MQNAFPGVRLDPPRVGTHPPPPSGVNFYGPPPGIAAPAPRPVPPPTVNGVPVKGTQNAFPGVRLDLSTHVGNLNTNRESTSVEAPVVVDWAIGVPGGIWQPRPGVVTSQQQQQQLQHGRRGSASSSTSRSGVGSEYSSGAAMSRVTTPATDPEEIYATRNRSSVDSGRSQSQASQSQVSQAHGAGESESGKGKGKEKEVDPEATPRQSDCNRNWQGVAWERKPKDPPVDFAQTQPSEHPSPSPSPTPSHHSHHSSTSSSSSRSSSPPFVSNDAVLSWDTKDMVDKGVQMFFSQGTEALAQSLIKYGVWNFMSGMRVALVATVIMRRLGEMKKGILMRVAKEGPGEVRAALRRGALRLFRDYWQKVRSLCHLDRFLLTCEVGTVTVPRMAQPLPHRIRQHPPHPLRRQHRRLHRRPLHRAHHHRLRRARLPPPPHRAPARELRPPVRDACVGGAWG